MSATIRTHLSLLGMRVTDRVTGLSGVVTSVCFDLYGCIQAIVNPGLDKDGKTVEQHWYDVNRLRIESDVPVMEQPSFVTSEAPATDRHDKGPAERPSFMKP